MAGDKTWHLALHVCNEEFVDGHTSHHQRKLCQACVSVAWRGTIESWTSRAYAPTRGL